MPNYPTSGAVNEVLHLLNLRQNTADAALFTGTSNTTVTGFSATNGIVRYLNMAIEETIRDCFPLTGTFSATWNATPMATPAVSYLPFDSFVATTVTGLTGSTLWFPRNVVCSQVITVGQSAVATPLRFCTEDYLRAFAPNYEYAYGTAGAVGPPIVAVIAVEFWYRKGQQGIGAYPMPYIASGDGGMPFQVDGLRYPLPQNIDASGTIDDFDTEVYKLTLYNACMKIISQRADDSRLSERIPFLEGWIGNTRTTLAERVDPTYKVFNGPYAHLMNTK